MSILVTGGAGYIGSITVEELVRAGESVIVYDNLSTGHREAVAPEAVFVEGDLGDAAKLSAVFETYDIPAVIHLAASTMVGESMKKPLHYYRNNVINSICLFEAMVKHGVRRLVFSSTSSVYSSAHTAAAAVCAPIPLDEDALLAPDNPYGETKLTVERILHWLQQAHGVEYVILRYFNAAGASRAYGEDRSAETQLIPLTLQVTLGLQDHLVIHGTDYPTRDGTGIRDYVHVVDLARAHILVLRAIGEGSRIYNLGTEQGSTVREVIDTVRKVTGHPIPVIEGPRRPGDPAIQVASADKIRRELGWEPAFPDLEATVRSAWEWRVRYPQGYSGST